LRAGPLSRQPIIKYLNDNFVNTSILIPEMKKAEEIFSDPVAVAWAKTVQQEFSYPVDSIVLSDEGKPLSQISIEEMFQALRSGKIGPSYTDILREAIESMK
jgi:hypothetical protein